MAGLILEVGDRHGRQYHRIEGAVLRVGRALDNDIIIADPTVSPYHFAIRRDPSGRYLVHPLADENGLRVAGRKVEEAVALDDLPLAFDAGRTRFRVRDPAQPVAPTRLISCRDGGLCLFGSWAWALVLFMAFAGVSLIENYLATHERLSWESFGSDQLVILSIALGLSLGLLLLNRLASQRWDYPASLSLVSLLLLAATLLDYLKDLTNYYLSSPAPGYLIDAGWHLLILPLVFAWFLVRLNHGRPGIAAALIIMLLTPSAYLHGSELGSYYGWFDRFSEHARYSNELLPWDVRQQQTISIADFGRAALARGPAPSGDDMQGIEGRD
jgi:hypothetical protein